MRTPTIDVRSSSVT